MIHDWQRVNTNSTEMSLQLKRCACKWVYTGQVWKTFKPVTQYASLAWTPFNLTMKMFTAECCWSTHLQHAGRINQCLKRQVPQNMKVSFKISINFLYIGSPPYSFLFFTNTPLPKSLICFITASLFTKIFNLINLQ